MACWVPGALRAGRKASGVGESRAIDAVVVAFRSEDVIEEAVRGLSPLGGQVVVVDHGDGQAALCAAALGAVAVHDPTNPGFGTGQNRGVAFTASPFILLCNPDAEVSAAAVRRGAELMRSRPDVAAVQGVITNAGSGAPERSQGVELGPFHLVGRAVGARRLLALSMVRSLVTRSHTLQDHAHRVPTCPTEVESLATTAVLVRRSAFEDAGGFDESYFLYGEDLDLCRRLRRAGWTLLAVPDVWATHQSGGSASSGWHRELHWWRGTMGFAARWWGPGAWSVAMTAATVRFARLALRCPRRAGEALSALVIQPVRDRQASYPAVRRSTLVPTP